MFCWRARRQEGWRAFCPSRRYQDVSFRELTYRAAAKTLLGIRNLSLIDRVIGAEQIPIAIGM
jgi:hypothetical protein